MIEFLPKSEINFFVKGEHYIDPTIIATEVPMDDPRGELQYFKEIRNCLEHILTYEEAPFNLPHAPDYIKQFFS